MNAEKQALLQRWAGFCAKIDGRLDELIANAIADDPDGFISSLGG